MRWKHKKENRKGKKQKQQEKKVDLYALLGLEDQRWTATEAQVRKAYQKQALKHHPDKATAGVTDEAEKAKIEQKFKDILARSSLVQLCASWANHGGLPWWCCSSDRASARRAQLSV